MIVEPVFVDRTGRRRRVVALAGSAGALVLVLAAVALIAGFTGTVPASLPGWAESRTERLRGDAPERSPAPSLSPRIRTAVPAAPTSEPGRTATTRPTPGASASTSAAAQELGNRRRIPTHTPAAPPGKKN
ncbi:hypothetical protein [Couchioplanes caeruleus]|uniref:Uncharacterized protein n=1 Tax=Couchioplanes caeruleus TaxID=56438 RepID=A0A3N1GGX9_9ACTN|nr:hypothetical protein [Couchioplanes caeruleus]ROP29539.1 hypothetical protein EDD30_2338 [Couchioplanes caeruleus]